MASDKIQVTRENGEVVDAQAPIIVSASRSTDIPAFYADWFLHRLKVGYSAWTNPFNGVRSYVAYDKTRLIVFWSKNPQPLLNNGGCLDYLAHKGINCYIQYTLNDYVTEKLERGVPLLQDRIDTFKITCLVLPAPLHSCSDCAYQSICGAEPVRNYSTQGDEYGYRPGSTLCKKNKAIIEHVFTLLDTRKEELMPIFQRWITGVE